MISDGCVAGNAILLAECCGHLYPEGSSDIIISQVAIKPGLPEWFGRAANQE